MNQHKSVSKSVSFIWLVKFYPVKWAYKPEEVPPWDPTRGFPIHIPSCNLYKRSKLEAEEKYRNPTLDTLRELLEEYEEKGGGQWEPKPPPERGYPRLVRANIINSMTPKRFGLQGEDVIIPLNSLIKPLDSLDQFVSSFHPPRKKVLKEVLALANKWGPAWDTMEKPGQDATGNTLSDWMTLVLECSAHLQMMEVLQDCGYEYLKGFLIDQYKQWLEIFGNDEKCLEVFYDLYAGPWFMLKWIAFHKARNDKEFRKEIANSLMTKISAPLKVYYSLDGWIAPMSVREQMRLQLARAWMAEQPVRVCEGCGRWFLSRRKNQRFCLGSKSSRCRDAKYRREKRAAQRSS